MHWLFWWRPPCLLRRVIVNLKNDRATAIQGVLWSARGPWLTLKDAALLNAGTPPTRMDGVVVIHRDNVEFFQVT